MARRHIAYSATPPLTHTLNVTKRWASTLSIWGVGAGSAALLFLSVTPLVKRELLVKIPLLKEYYIDNTPASDKPF
ncbi:ubiquinol-cytochrome-c reductase complex subunit-domain-containing protein [Roridomyces roridus]|uniref:Ubiquinol-cytochrome-c reductase complex subunit-domain-containing protein n=1 Tax=Roridomyces roridus TaxID=1738132 RepID=A0AAD7BVM7_9AGAR|nr:ubiquinol-cytochrome-c reductase complex subunit-domain-containing protein [Roridomyces roridus]